ncbi:MAG TPA: hypothetical protein PKL84_07725, partial [Candidatus Hydrogenedentes bacterium]|nr:hypothetical protein [Candidatus Hydrogenedentota bacterium]
FSMRTMTIVGILVLAAAAALGQQVRITPAGATLETLAGSGTLVTVVIEGLGAEDPNLRIVELFPDFLVALDENNERTPYLYSSIQEIRVQGGQVEKKTFELAHTRMLRGPELEIVQRAGARARAIFHESAADQTLRINAAALLLLAGDAEAREYLLRLARSGDSATEIEAAIALYLAGDPAVRPGTPYPLAASGAGGKAGDPLIPDITRRGLEHSRRDVRGRAAALAGLVNDEASLLTLRRMASDRLAELCAPAARALVHMEQRDVIPRLLELIMERDKAKGEAAIYGLTKFGDADIVSRVKAQLPLGTGEVQFRLVRVLFALGDPEGRTLMVQTLQDIPTLAHLAALYLAEQGDMDAKVYLQRRLDKREDLTEENMEYRANAASALILGGDHTGATVLAELLRQDNETITSKVCAAIVDLGRVSLLTLTQPPLESGKQKVAIEAAAAAISLADQDFRERLLRYRAAL